MKTTRWATVFVTSSWLLLSATSARAQLNFCFGPTILRSVPNPVFDGDIDHDNGWLNAFTFRGGNGAPDANIILLGNNFVDGAHHWMALGVTALNDTEWDAGDAVVILYHASSGFGQLVISPLQNDVAPTTAVANGKPGTSKYYTSTTGASGSWTDQGSAPAWVTWGALATASGGPCTAAQPGTACRWNVELGIDTAASGAPSGFDQIYVDVVEIFDRSGPKSYQYSWPPGLSLVDATDTTLTPTVTQWGGASTSANACKGVFFGFNDISASPLDINGNLQAGLATTFTVKLHNSGPDAAGVVTHFSHAPFGVCGLVDSCFHEFGSTTTTTSCPNAQPPGSCCTGAPACIPADTTTTGVPGAGTGLQAQWTPAPADEGHQCIRVKLEATQGNTTFANSGDFHNMWVDHASTVKAHARIDMKGVPAPAGGGSKQRVRMNSLRTTQYAYADGTIADVPIGTLTAQMLTEYVTYRFTGKFVTIPPMTPGTAPHGIKSEIWDPVGSYAFTVQHAMPAEFKQAFEGRHAQLIDGLCRRAELPRDQCLKTLRIIRALNAALAGDAEKVQLTDWSIQVDGVTHVGNNNDQVEFQVPLDGVVTLPTTISYVGGGDQGGHGRGCLSCFQPKRTASTLGITVAMLLMVGVFIDRRRQ